mgnify:CR=1 FL=1
MHYLMGYFKEFDAIKKANEKYKNDMESLKSELEKQKNMIYPDEERKKKAIKEVKQKKSNREEKYSKALDKGYLKEVEKIKSSVGFGNGSAQETVAELSDDVLNGKSKTEIQLLANKYAEQGNYEGQRILREKMANSDIPVVNLGDFQSMEEKIDDLDKYYKGKKRRVRKYFGEVSSRLGSLKEEAGLL